MKGPHPRHFPLLLLALLALVTQAGAEAPLRVETVATGLEHPWSLAFLPDGNLLVTERPGRLRQLDARGRLSAPLAGVPKVHARGQGGLFDVLVAPAHAENRRLYLSYAEADAQGRSGLAVASATLDAANSQLRDVQVIFRQQPFVKSDGHYGGRLVLARDGHLFITLGDRQLDSEREKAQSLLHHHGKVVRINTDGKAPTDNPWTGQRTALPGIYSLGHRNPQGAALHPQTGELWITEHGPQGGDEVNIVRPGRNYGWPVITYGCEYGSCGSIGQGTHKRGMEQPVTYWVPRSIAPSGLAFYTGNRYPGWRNNLFSGALAGRALWRLELEGERVLVREMLLADLGERIRDVRQGPDELLYLLTDSTDGRILRLLTP